MMVGPTIVLFSGGTHLNTFAHLPSPIVAQDFFFYSPFWQDKMQGINYSKKENMGSQKIDNNFYFFPFPFTLDLNKRST